MGQIEKHAGVERLRRHQTRQQGAAAAANVHKPPETPPLEVHQQRHCLYTDGTSTHLGTRVCLACNDWEGIELTSPTLIASRRMFAALCSERAFVSLAQQTH